MSFCLLDTNICIHFTKNEYGIVEKLDSIGFDNCFISELTMPKCCTVSLTALQPNKPPTDRR